MPEVSLTLVMMASRRCYSLCDKNQQELSPEDKKILDDAHKNRDNPEHPAHKDHPKV